MTRMAIAIIRFIIHRALVAHVQHEDWVSTCKSRAAQRFYAALQIYTKTWHQHAIEKYCPPNLISFDEIPHHLQAHPLAALRVKLCTPHRALAYSRRKLNTRIVRPRRNNTLIKWLGIE